MFIQSDQKLLKNLSEGFPTKKLESWKYTSLKEL